MSEFMMPEEPEAVFMPDSELPMKVQNLLDFSGGCSQDISDVAEGVAFKLCDQNPLCIIEQQNFDHLCSVVRCFEQLDAPKRRQLLDALCSSLTCLNACIDRILATPADSEEREGLVDVRSAFKAYLFFLQWISKIAEAEARNASATASAATAAGGRGKGRKKGADDSVWEWSAQFAKVMKAVGRALNTDLWALFRPTRPDPTVLLKLIQLSAAALETPAAAKDEELAAGAAHVLAVTAVKYQQMDAVAGTLVEALNRHEHTPPVVAELLRYAVAQFDDGRLAAAVIAELAAVEPAEYERQQNATGEKAGVRSVAAFVEEMASRLPRLMAAQIALLLPHLGGKAWTLRSGIVSAVGRLIHKAFEPSGDAQEPQSAVVARLRSKQHLLDILCERVRDNNSYTRKAVLHTWQYLAEHRAIPLGHWQVVTQIAAGRLEDKSSLVRKEALRLLGCLMQHNPFGPALPVDRFEASLAVHRAMLDAVMPGGSVGDEMAEGVEIDENGAQDGDAAAAGGEGAQGDANAGAENAAAAAEGDEEMEDASAGEGEEGGAAAENEQAAVAQEQEALPQAKTPAEVGWDGSVEELQALVASLELAVDFARSLAGCMPVLVQLLASSTVSDVQEAIAMLLTCKQFEVAGAPDAIRKMLPLVFSTDQAVKDRIVEALDRLYVSGWAGAAFTSAQAARNLVDLASGANLGELGSLEEVVKELVDKTFVTPVTLHEIWEIVDRAGAAVEGGIAGSGRARRDRRAALAVLSMAAAVVPAAFAQRHVATLLRLGFAEGRAADALTTRHACTALQRLADNFKDGLYDGVRDQMYTGLVRTLVASPLPESTWYSAAEAAIAALYNLHPAPEHICAAVVRHWAAKAFAPASQAETATSDSLEHAEEEDEANEAAAADLSSSSPTSVSTQALSRFFFVVGHVALQHLVLIERAAKAVRRARHEAEKRAAEDKAERAARPAKAPQKNGTAATPDSEGEEDDINAELGVGSVAADAELDAMKEACEAQILAAQNLLGPYARLVSAVCQSRSLLGADPTLRSSALLALSKLMVVDPKVCDDNLQLLFTLLQARSVEPSLRSNITVALGDLALRWPNLLEPWTEHVYRPLDDPDAGVRKNALMVLSHLILNDMMKVKGHIAKMAMCLEDGDARVAALAALFFHELAKKEYKGTSPIYNLLPDILSNLSREPALGRAGFQSVMQRLLGYIKKDKQGDALVEKLCQRFAATEDPGQWRNVAFCLSQLPVSDKGLRRLAEGFKLYKTALADPETAELIVGVLAKGKKSGAKPEIKALVEELEAKIEACAVERAEEEAAAAAAEERAALDKAAAAAAAGGGEDAVAEASAAAVEEEEEAQDMEMGEAEEEAAEELQPASSDAASLVAAGAAAQEEESQAGGAEEASSEEEEEDGVAEEKDSSSSEEEEVEVKHKRKAAAAPKARATRRTAKPAVAVKEEEEEEEEAVVQRPTRRSTRSSGGGGGARKAAAPAKPAATRGGRRAKAIVDSEGDEESDGGRIAAVRNAVASMKVEDDSE